jgi:hypothetical protein
MSGDPDVCMQMLHVYLQRLYFGFLEEFDAEFSESLVTAAYACI